LACGRNMVTGSCPRATAASAPVRSCP